MAKLIRKNQKIFCGGSDVTTHQKTAFGTAKTTPVYTDDVETIQTEIYDTGWSSSLESDLAPFMQDSNSLHYLETRQLSYLFQEGVPEWNTNTTYYKGSLAKVTNDIYCNIYKSITDDNTGKDVTDTDNWVLYIADSNMAHYPIGDIRMTLSTTKLDNELWLMGNEGDNQDGVVSRITYKSLFDIFGTTYGEGDGSTTFSLPNFTNRTPWGSLTFGYIAAGIPNIKGSFCADNSQVGNTSEGGTKPTGAFYKSKNLKGYDLDSDTGASATGGVMGFNANTGATTKGIYSDSITTVQTPSIKVRFKTRWY